MKRTTSGIASVVLGIVPFLPGCAEKPTLLAEPVQVAFSQKPLYSTNSVPTQATDYNSDMLDSFICTSDFGNSGDRIIGEIKEQDIITDLEGKVLDRERFLALWTLKEGEYGYDINRDEQHIALRTPENKVRIYELREGVEGLRTNKTYVEHQIPDDARAFAKRHPDFWIPSYSTTLNGQDTELFYSTISEEGAGRLSFVPNPSNFYLFGGQVDVKGPTYIEIWGKVQSVEGGKINKDAVVTAELILTNPATGDSVAPKSGD